MVLDQLVAAAGDLLQSGPIANRDRGATGGARAARPKILEDARGVTAARAEQHGQFIVRERHDIIASALGGGDHPLGGTLLG